MMMGEDKKRTLQIIIGSAPADDAGEGDEAAAAEEAKKAAFNDFAEAVKAGDEAKGVEAFKTMYELCAYAKAEESGGKDDGASEY